MNKSEIRDIAEDFLDYLSDANCCQEVRTSKILDAENNIVLSPNSSQLIAVRSLCNVEVSSTELEVTLRVGNERELLIRYLKFEMVSDSDLSSSSESEEKTQPQSRGEYISLDNFIPGERPDMLYEKRLKMKWGLPPCHVPNEVKNAIKRGVYNPNKILASRSDTLIKEDLQRALEPSNYKSKFKRLLHIEEWKHQQDIKMYDMRGVTLTQRKRGSKLLYLKVPGLAEKRPSVLRGDKIYVRAIGRNGHLEIEIYQGYVHHVEQEEVGLGFNSWIFRTHIKNKIYFVRFEFNRLALKLMHRSVEAMFSRPDIREILFPVNPPRYLPTKVLKMYNRDIDGNEEQREAVHNIVEGITAPVYIIYGPPGTGKTITMVEVIHQTLRRHPFSHMLVCAPSNSACDLLTSRLLLHVDKREILRMHAASRNWGEVPEDVKGVSNYRGEFRFPAKEELMKCRIIVTTLITAGRIASAKFPKEHFDRVFIDEAGQAMEPETMIAVAGVLSENGKMVLAGDPKQLGPVIRSSIAKSYGLQISFLERLMSTCDMYQKHNTDYRPQCHNQIVKKLSFSSEYNSSFPKRGIFMTEN
uniref:LOW QUALITY PROTEIN: helicase MOV-10-like n=1 Tax=Styela clava TaxID=7725 RepID=UPI00193AC095|nr:LOW QUALITY PROTEIN: helicase MOV-10-like [Styela clava]